jgi:hypothetical protein
MGGIFTVLTHGNDNSLHHASVVLPEPPGPAKKDNTDSAFTSSHKLIKAHDRPKGLSWRALTIRSRRLVNEHAAHDPWLDTRAGV